MILYTLKEGMGEWWTGKKKGERESKHAHDSFLQKKLHSKGNYIDLTIKLCS